MRVAAQDVFSSFIFFLEVKVLTEMVYGHVFPLPLLYGSTQAKSYMERNQ